MTSPVNRSIPSDYSTLCIHHMEGELDTVYFAIHRTRYGMVEVIHEGVLKQKTKDIFTITIYLKGLLDATTYSFYGFRESKLIVKKEGSLSSLVMPSTDPQMFL